MTAVEGRGWRDEPDYQALKSRQKQDMVLVGPLLAFLHDAFPDADRIEMGRLLKLDSSNTRRLFDGTHVRISLLVVDRVLTDGLGRPDLLDALYPLEET